MSDQQQTNGAASTAVARFNEPRLPWHGALEERYGDIGVTKATWKALVEAIYPAAQSVDSVLMALSYCKARKLDPFKRPVHIVPVYDSNRGGYVDTVWPGISELRTTAFRTGLYAGCDDATYGPDVTRVFSGKVGKKQEQVNVSVTFPEWCQVTVHRLVGGQRVPVAGPKVYWMETYATRGRTEVPNEMWAKRPRGQLEKCAEAAALRKAFPEELGNEYAAEEMEGRRIGPEAARDVTPALEAPPRPQRSDYTGEHPGLTPEPAAEPEAVDGEIIGERTPLVDAVGEVVGDYEVDAWFEEFFAALGDGKTDRKLRAQMLRNNLDAASTLWAQSGRGRVHQFYAELGRLGFTHEDYQEPAGSNEPPAPASAGGEAGAADPEPPAAPAEPAPEEPVSYPLVDETGAPVHTDGSAPSFVKALEGMLDFPGLSPEAKNTIWRRNWPVAQRVVNLGDEDLNGMLRKIQAQCVAKKAAAGKPGTQGGRLAV